LSDHSQKDIIILGVESSCDDTSAAIIKDGKVLSNVVAGQDVHKIYGGVVPELASRAHQQNIIPVVDTALRKAGIQLEDLSAIAFTRGPGLLGALLVGTSFSKALGLALNIPIIDVNHMQGHVLAHFLKDDDKQNVPNFPFLCLTVSGGHTQIVLVRNHLDMEVIGQTIDDAAGEAFDKVAKIMGFSYPGGPLVDKHAKGGDINRFEFPHPKIQGLNYSFSGLKTSFLYFIRDEVAKDPDFIEKNKSDICASIQYTIVKIVLAKLKKAAEKHNIQHIAIAGGVSANSYLREQLKLTGEKKGWNVFVPKFEYCTDNAAMIAITGHYKFLEGQTASQNITPLARLKF